MDDCVKVWLPSWQEQLLKAMEETEVRESLSYLSNSHQSNHDFSHTCSRNSKIHPTADDKPTTKLVYDYLSPDDLKKLKEEILQNTFDKSNALVELLQERQNLSEEVHFRLISIEQLHKLLETSCCFQSVLLSWLNTKIYLNPFPVAFISGNILWTILC